LKNRCTNEIDDNRRNPGVLQLFSLMAVGFFFGMRHATDADHVVAIATIVTRERSLRGAARIGLLWGLGHSVTVAVVGAAIILFGVVIPPRVGLAMEFGVGLMLVVLGVFTLRAVALQAREALSLYLLHGHHGHPSAPTNGHTHLHVHGDYVHAHTHGHAHDTHGHPEHATPQGWLDKRFGRLEAYRALRPVIVGIVHGLAGSAAVALLVLASIRDPLWGLAYLFVFGLGTMVGMMLITVLIAAPFALGASRVPAISAGVRAVAGVLSLAFGLFLMYQIGLVDGLFTGQPTWTPR
jgi:high-affinity nickel-transport protein